VIQKITIIGNGLAGMLAVNLFNHKSNIEIECLVNESKPQDVGISATLDFYLYMNFMNGIGYQDVKSFKGHHKTGVLKTNFNKDYFQSFDLSNISCQFNSLDVIEYLKTLNNNISYVTIDKKDIDSDFILDTSGKPKLNKDYTTIDAIPVNKALGVKIKWQHADFDYTSINARPYGYISCIPTKDYLFVTYIHNSKYNTELEIKDDLTQYLKDNNRVCDVSNYVTLNFKNYYRNNTKTNNTFYSGNSAFFIEPFEATSLSGILRLNAFAYEYIEGITPHYPTNDYLSYIKESIEMILIHYLSGSVYDTPFWSMAEQNAINYFSNFASDYLKEKLIQIEYPYKLASRPSYFYDIEMFKYNLDNLGVLNKLKELVK
jgi:hypothetical protein